MTYLCFKCHKTLTKSIYPLSYPLVSPGLPGDEGPPRRKPHARQVKANARLGQVVDDLLVPEHKAARRLIRRSQRHKPDDKMAAITNNMTLYERIIAYRKLKQRETGGESKQEDGLERSETGWGSVDISQYTYKKEDEEARTPTPPPTLTSHEDRRVDRNRKQKSQDYDEKLTARDVYVDVDENLNKKEPLPPVRSATPVRKRTPSPLGERSASAQELNRHSVLPPIQGGREERREEEIRRERVNEVRSERYSVDDRREGEAVVATSAVVAAASMRKEDRRYEEDDRDRDERRDERRYDERTEDIRETSRKEDRRYDEEDRNRNVRREEKRYEEEENRRERIRRDEKEDLRSRSREEEKERRYEKREEEERYERKERDSRREEYRESRNREREERGGRDRDRYDTLETAAVVAASSSTRRQSPAAREENTPQQRMRRDNTPPRSQPRSEPVTSQRAMPRVEGAVAAAASGNQPRRSPGPRNERRGEEQRKSRARRPSVEEEIDRLDKMVDRELNSIIDKHASKPSNNNDNKSGESQLKEKIFHPSFQADMDRFLRDI
ncbi:trichohyalin [Aplysia californica]|uniref:Trichohyalin n=1 Tax=Aplysia californica TaxID=6500 RepID=A0ABM1VT47_APLCA|nr:trichohyalin [Aplysia californica]